MRSQDDQGEAESELIRPQSIPGLNLPGRHGRRGAIPRAGGRAVAYGGGGQDAVLRVFPLGSGVAQGWLWPRVPWTPLIQGQGTWTADRRTLVLQQWDVSRDVGGKPPASDTPAGTTAVRIIDTSASAGTAGMGRPLTLRGPAGLSAPWQPFLTPDGSTLIATTGTGSRALLAGGGVTLTGGDLLPGSPGGYGVLQDALLGVTGVPSSMTW